MINKKAYFVTALLCLCSSLYSQSVLGLQYPMGIPLRSGTGPSLSMSGIGVGVSNDYYGMAENPANLGVLNRAIFSALLSADFLNILDREGSTNHVNFSPRLFSFCFPIGFLGAVGFSVGQAGDTDVKFRLTENLNMAGITETADLALIKEGGSINWQAGWGYSLNKRVNLGLTYQRLYFNSETSIFKQTEGTLSDTLLDRSSISFSGNGLSGGVQVSISDFTVGFKGQYYFLNNAESKQFIMGTRVKSNLTNDTLSDNFQFEFKPAPSLAFGASYQISPEWLTAFSVDAVLWDRFYSERPYSENFDDAYSFSAGGQYIPAPNLLTPEYYEIIQYRAGFRFSQLPVSTASEFAFTLGAGLPLREGGGLFDISFEYGRRHDSRYENYSEEFFRIYLGINAGRKWYQSAEESY